MAYRSPIQNTLYNGGGAILMSALDANDNPVGGYYNIGTCDAASIAYTISEIEQKDAQRGTLQTVKKIVTEKSGEVTIAAKSFSAENMAMALFGELAEDAETTVNGFEATAYVGRFVNLDGIVKSVSVVTDGSASFVEGTDFVVNGGTLYIPEGSSIADGTAIQVTYVKASVARVEGMIEGSKEVAIVFEGTNVADDSKAVKVTIHKVSLSPTEQRDLISAEGFATLTIKGTILASNATDASESNLVKEEYQV